MDKPAEESRVELDLDNRKLIIVFVLLICVCAGFYVFGFVEGKRQAKKSGEQKVNATAPAQLGAPAPSETKTQSAEPPAQAAREKAVKEQLDWYKNVRSGGAPSAKGLTEEKKATARTKAGTAKKSVPPPRKSRYSVQIGAFKHKREAEAKAALLKAKGYDYIIEAPGAGTQLHLLKVGRFESRAQAYAIQQKLKKDGFSSFIKAH